MRDTIEPGRARRGDRNTIERGAGLLVPVGPAQTLQPSSPDTLAITFPPLRGARHDKLSSRRDTEVTYRGAEDTPR